jgi:hypothetical protein
MRMKFWETNLVFGQILQFDFDFWYVGFWAKFLQFDFDFWHGEELSISLGRPNSLLGISDGNKTTYVQYPYFQFSITRNTVFSNVHY